MKFVVVLALILCCAAFANSLKIFKQNGSNTLACCGSGRTFDTTTQICCINTVFSIPDSNSNNQAACCGTRLLTNDQICCEAIPGAPSSNDRAIPSSQQCCGTRGYDPATQLCCLGNVISNNNNNLQCCGTRSYNPSNDLCCPDALSTSANVVANGVTNGQSCCGNSGFNPTNQLCCGGRAVSNSNNNLQCCNAALFTTSFDPTSQTCCLGVVNSGGAGLSCCGTRSYNPATSLCCDTTVVNNPNGNLQCCGSRTFDPATQTCCRVDTTTFKSAGTNCAGCKTFTAVVTSQFQVTNIPQSSAQCCGLTAFSTASSQCCNGRINPLVSSTNVPRSCCGTTTYDPTADLCCPTTTAANALPIVGGVGRPNTACCGTTTYNTLTQTCQCGKQVTKTQDINELGGLGACCGTTQYNNISATCCSSSFGNFLYPLQPAAGWKCCPQDGQSLYNPGYQVCCDRKKNCPPNPTKLSIRDVEEVVSIDFRPLKGNFDPRDSHDFAALLEKHARATRSVEEVEQVEQVEQVEEAEEAEDVEDLEKKKKKKKKKSNKKADSRSRTSGNIDNNDKEKFSLVQCGDTCCNGQGFYSHFQRCCGTEFTGYNVIDVSNTDVASSPLACCGNNIYNTQFEGCCTEARSTIDSCGNQKANYGIWKRDIELCCTD